MSPAHVITVFDGVHHGTRRDDSGDLLVTLLIEAGFAPVGRSQVPDESDEVAAAIQAATATAPFVVTTGGTGFGPRDVTPEATAALITRPAPGIVHLMTAAGLSSTPMAALSRATAGVVTGDSGEALVVNLPGSPRAREESLNAILPVVPHALQLLAGHTGHGDE